MSLLDELSDGIKNVQNNMSDIDLEKLLKELIDNIGDELDGAQKWVKSFVYGEFGDNRPVSTIVAEMITGFVPGMTLVYSARDSVAVTMRMVNHPEKQDDIQEWMLLAAYLLPFVITGATTATGAGVGAAGGAVAAGAGAVPGAGIGAAVGAATGSVLANVAKCVGLFMIQKTPHLATIIQKLAAYTKGNTLTMIKKLKFSDYGQGVTSFVTGILGSLLAVTKRVKAALSYGAKINWMGLGWAKTIYERMARFEAAIISMINKAKSNITQVFKEFDQHLQQLLKQKLPPELAYATVAVEAKLPQVAKAAKASKNSLPTTATASAAHGSASSMGASHAGGGSNVHPQKPKAPPVKKMKEHKVGCFDPPKTAGAKANANKMIKEDYPKGSNKLSTDEYLNKELDWQLAGQQKGLNEMSVDDYIKGRKAFDGGGRGSGAPQSQARKDFAVNLQEKYEKQFTQQQKMGPIQAEQEAKAKTKRIMDTMAALHNPDQLLAGKNAVDPKAMGLKNVNSSIGGQWGDPQKITSRVALLDEAAKKVPVSERTATGMQVKLERCK